MSIARICFLYPDRKLIEFVICAIQKPRQSKIKVVNTRKFVFEVPIFQLLANSVFKLPLKISGSETSILQPVPVFELVNFLFQFRRLLPDFTESGMSRHERIR